MQADVSNDIIASPNLTMEARGDHHPTPILEDIAIDNVPAASDDNAINAEPVAPEDIDVDIIPVVPTVGLDNLLREVDEAMDEIYRQGRLSPTYHHVHLLAPMTRGFITRIHPSRSSSVLVITGIWRSRPR